MSLHPSTVELSIRFRGTIIHELAEIENRMDHLLVCHFCPVDVDLQLQFACALLGHRSANLAYKYDAFLFVLNNSYEEIYKKHKVFLRKFMKDIIEFRNAIAHVPLERSHGKKEEFKLQYITQGEREPFLKETTLSDQIIQEKIEIMRRMQSILDEAAKEIYTRKSI